MKTNKILASEIQDDLDRGVYDQFPKIKERMQFISNKLIKAEYCINSEAQLSTGELKTLEENGYIENEKSSSYYNQYHE